MSIFKSRKDKKRDSREPVKIAVIPDTVSSEIFQNILKENNVPYICTQQGAGGYLKIVTGGFLVADSIYVNPDNAEFAKRLYEAYLKTEMSFVDSEED